MNLINIDKWNELPSAYKGVIKNRLGTGQQRDDGALRYAQPAGSEEAGGGRHQAASVQPGNPGSLLQCCQQGLCGNQRRKRRVQEAA
jgi:hypothetical protein